MVLLDLWVEALYDIIHNLTSDLIVAVAGALPACVLISHLKDLKGPEPAHNDQSDTFPYCSCNFVNWESLYQHFVFKPNAVTKG